eukprot:scaffold129858_cov27-Tisochrysis_lutea.AAC.7
MVAEACGVYITMIVCVGAMGTAADGSSGRPSKVRGVRRALGTTCGDAAIRVVASPGRAVARSLVYLLLWEALAAAASCMTDSQRPTWYPRVARRDV